jgi:predicted ATPase/signal transduction histidine kinase/PAS domain-containing protein
MFGRRTHVSTGERFEVVRAACDGDPQTVVLKTVRSDRRAPRAEELLRHEWNVLRGLGIDGVARPLGLELGDGGPVLVLADAGPRNLRELLDGKPLDTSSFLELAIPMAEVIAEVHRRGVIHRDVSPMNFVVGERPTLVDFETATATPAFAQAPCAPGELEGTLGYIAPEQTGRMNRGVDRRADLYALGATFYEMLTGAPPFSARDPLELLHAHVARRPHTPAVVNASVPTVLSNIVVKLLSKMPEWRYQSADALKTDLDEARARWRSTGKIETFELGLGDVPYGLLIAGHLYGREKAHDELQRTIERVGAGRAEVVLVTGPAGIGKSALVRQVRELAPVKCRWLEGKSDPLRGNVPYLPLLDALRGFVRETSHLPEDRVASLRDRLRSAVSPNGRVLTDGVPELRQLIGEVRPVAEVGPVETENRFRHVFIAFLRALVEERTPLVLFLEDLQWADPASIQLLAAIAAEPDVGGLLVIGTHRTGDGADHALEQAATRMRTAGTPVATVELGALEKRSVVALLCEALRVDPEQAAPLAETIGKKTAGNPFFVRRFLVYLYEAGLLAYDPQSGRWSWDIARIDGAEVTANVVDLLARSIAMLPAREQGVLATAACVGSEFGLGQLAAVRGEALDDVARALWDPVRQGLIVPVASGPRFRWAGEQPVELGVANAPAYRFVHDRIQEATWRSLGVGAQKELNLKIGRWLLANVPAGALDDAICQIVDHLDRAADRLDANERDRLAELNHRAGRVARASAAYASALRYFSAGLELLSPRPWGTDRHQLWFALVRDEAECAALTGEHAACERLVQRGLAHTDVPLEKAELFRVLAQSSALQGAHRDAIRSGREGLRILGVDLPPPSEVSGAAAHVESERTRRALRDRSERDLLETAPMEDAEERARLRLFVALAAATWFTAPELFRVVCSRAVALTTRRGVAQDSPFAFAAYAIALAMDGEYEEAHRFGRLAVGLAERASNPAQECRALMVLGGHVGPWRAPLRDSLPVLRKAYTLGVESGELEYAAYALANLIFALWFRGATVESVLGETDAALAFYRKIGHLGGMAYLVPFMRAARCLRGLTRENASFDDDEFDEETFLRDAAENGLAQAVYHVLRVQACTLLDEPAKAVAYARRGERWLPHLRTIFFQADHHLYTALALSSMYDAASATEEQDALLSELRRHHHRLEVWSRHSPATFGHKRDLVAAEVARLEGHPGVAELYERAIESARREGCPHEEALAHERCARFLARRGDPEAEVHFRWAGEGYAAWGALAKVRRMAKERPSLADVARSPSAAAAGSDGALQSLDLEVLLRASETLTSELVLDRLLQKLMPVCIGAASAERAVLVLEESGPMVRAVASAHGEVTVQRTRLAASDAAPSSVIEQVLHTGAEVVVGDALGDARFASDPHVARSRVRSVLAVPLRRQDRTVGILYFENNLATDAFTPERVEVFRLLSGQIVVALQNSLLFEEHRRVEGVLTLLADASAALSESLDYEQVLATLGALAVPALADWCVVDVVEGRRLVRAAGRHADPSKQSTVEELNRAAPVDVDSPQFQAHALRSREALLVPEVTQDFMRAGARDEGHLRLVQSLEPRSLMVLPLVAHGRGIGVLTLVRNRAERPYEDRDLSVAEEFARRAALALDNARLHRALNERGRDLRLMFRQAPGAIWATDRSLKFTHAAGNMLNAQDVDVRALLGNSLYDFVGTRDPTEPGVARHLAALAGEPQSFQYRYRDRWYDVSIEPLRDQEQTIVGCVGAAFDVTELKDGIRKLEHALSRWEAALGATAEGILVVDLEGNVSAVNQRFLSLWRIPPHAAQQRQHLKMLESVVDQLEDPSSFLGRVREIYANPEQESFDLIPFTDGRLFERQSMPQRIGGEIVGRVWSLRDVTERERLFRRALFLADATRLLASLDVEPALDSVAHIAVPYLGDGCAIDLLGEGGPRRLLAVSRDATQPIQPELHPSVIAGHPTIYPVGERSYMAVPLLVKGALAGAITFAASPSRRYTPDDLELAEELARRAALSVENARLYRGAQDALQARDEFLSIAAHEIRGPITSMHMAVQGIEQGKIPPAAMSKVLEIVQREDRRLARFVDELLDVGRIRSGRMQFTFEQVDLNDVVRTAAARLGAELARSGSSLSVTTDGRGVGQWDKSRLEQVVTNLLSNAIKFGLGKPIAVSVKAHDGRVWLVVKDHGIGIPPRMHQRIFLPFERAVAVRHYGGLGLGLFIVRTVVEGLGGRISLESSPNAGSTFTVELPQGRGP